jgi:outer membrane protein assembly factor BamA
MATQSHRLDLREPDRAFRPAGLMSFARRAGAFALSLALASAALAQATAPPLPTFAELEAAGATIGEVVIRNGDIFDTNDPAEDNWLFRTVNNLHINTRENVVRRTLLFASGEPLRAAKIEESERILRTSRNYADVRMRPLAVKDGVVDIEVATQDAWSLYPGLSLSRSGGSNSYQINIREYNFLGTGTSVLFGKTSDIDRSGNEFEISNDRAFGTWTRVGYTHARNDDGSREGVSVVRPFYALDARWAAGASWLRNDRIEANYVNGEAESEYRYKESRAEVFGGWSQGLRQGWVNRFSAGMRIQDDVYTNEPDKVAPASLAPDQKLVYPFVRVEWIEDRYRRMENHDQIGRPEFFAMGLSAFLDVGYASQGMGSSRDAWVYSGYLGRGFELAGDRTLLASAAVTGQYTDGRVDRQQFGGRVQYFQPHDRRFLLYASATADVLTNPGPTDQLLLGGDNGLRGFPLRYQSGTRRALFSVEERAYSDIFLWRLFRLGAAAYVDVGRAWGGPYQNTEDSGWLANVGIGLRIFNVRSAFATVLHVDLAFPINPGASVDRVQFLFRTRASF